MSRFACPSRPGRPLARGEELSDPFPGGSPGCAVCVGGEGWPWLPVSARLYLPWPFSVLCAPRSLKETAHLLRSPRNAVRLLGALARSRGEGGIPFESIEALAAAVEPTP